MKKIVLFLVSFFLITVSVNADFEITVDGNIPSTTNTTMVFSETNIGPGFIRDYNIKVINNSSMILVLRSNSINIIQSSILLDKTYLSFEKDSYIIFTGIANNFIDKEIDLICIDPGTENDILLNLYFDKWAGNIYQGKSFKLEFVFEVYEVAECPEIIPPDPPVEPEPELPDTGESRIVYYILFGSIGLILCSMLVLFILINRETKEKENEQEKKKRK